MQVDCDECASGVMGIYLERWIVIDYDESYPKGRRGKLSLRLSQCRHCLISLTAVLAGWLVNNISC